jgi:LPS sulfotransferase NodH
MRQSPSIQEIAESYALWGEWFDTAGIDTRESFDAMPIADRLALVRYASESLFTDETTDETTTETPTDA